MDLLNNIGLSVSVILTICMLVLKGETLTEFTARKRSEFDNKITNKRLLWQRQERGMFHCLGECSRDERCVSIFYNKASSKCQGHSITFGSQHDTELETGNLYYVRTNGEGYIGDSCSGVSDCVTINTECRDGGCWCAPGFGFSPRTQECLSDCDRLGDDFTEFRDFYISKTNVEVFDPVSLDDCFYMCKNRTSYSCVSMEFSRVSDKCYLSNATYKDWPTRWYQDVTQSFEISYYERDCI